MEVRSRKDNRYSNDTGVSESVSGEGEESCPKCTYTINGGLDMGHIVFIELKRTRTQGTRAQSSFLNSFFSSIEEKSYSGPGLAVSLL